MANAKPRRARTIGDINAPEESTNFYESMPMTGYPHSIYRDDEVMVDENDTTDDSAEAARQVTALITVAGVSIVVLGLLVMLAYGLITLGNESSNSLTTSSTITR